ncbi:MAG TPA: hypothetical protein VKG22_11260, partial [Stellaceae bacterium]|nr:hypothetical protein [Stellaceae bacterium]
HSAGLILIVRFKSDHNRARARGGDELWPSLEHRKVIAARIQLEPAHLLPSPDVRFPLRCSISPVM